MKRYLFILSSLLLIACSQGPAEVVVVSALHGAHNNNSNYTYEDLYAFIEEYQPDIVGVEIRAEDIDSSLTYLRKSYPREMYEIRDKYIDRTVGIDWLGEDIEGQPIPEGYFQNLEVLQLAAQLEQDSSFKANLGPLEELAELKTEIAFSNDIVGLNEGKYDSLNEEYYELLYQLYAGSPYEKISDFYRKRDENITANIIETVDSHPGKKLIFIVGADHRSRAIISLNKLPANSVRIIKIE